MSNKRDIIIDVSAITAGVFFMTLSVMAYFRPAFLGMMGALLAFGVVVLYGLYNLLSIAFTGAKAFRLKKVDRFIVSVMIICATFYLGPPLGRYLADREFSLHAVEYNRVISAVNQGDNRCYDACMSRWGLVNVEEKPSDVRAVLATTCDGRHSYVAFLRKTDVPLLREGYLFAPPNDEETCLPNSERPARKWYTRRVTGAWFHIANQPGL